MLICCCDAIVDLGCQLNCTPVLVIEKATKGLYNVKWEFGGLVYSQDIQTEKGGNLEVSGLQVGTHTLSVEFGGNTTCYRVKVLRSNPYPVGENEIVKTIKAC